MTPPPPSRPPVVTLDGPAGSGKSTTARAVARELGFKHLDSGALYRALTLALLDSGAPPEQWPALSRAELEEIPVEVDASGGEVEILLRGRRLGPELRTPRVTDHVSQAAGLPAVRARLLDLQRQAGAHGGLVADGRDMGTVVFPDAEVKVFLTADLEERARRRLIQEGGGDLSPERVGSEASRLAQRDHRDRSREEAPLRIPQGAVELDTTGLAFEEQVRRIVALVKELTGPEALP